MLNRETISGLLRTREIGRALTCCDVIESTGAAARDAARAGAPPGAVFVAAEQSAGRGRFDRVWRSPQGGLWTSLLLRPGNSGLLPGLPMAAALALKNSLKNAAGIDAGLAWPNDLVHSGKKLAGILTEPSFSGDTLDFAVLGIGVNVNNSSESLPDDIRQTATSCMDILKKEIPLETLLAAFLNEFEKHYGALLENGLESTAREWRAALGLIGNAITVKQGDDVISGVVTHIGTQGQIEITAGGEKKVIDTDSGSIHTEKYNKIL